MMEEQQTSTLTRRIIGITQPELSGGTYVCLQIPSLTFRFRVPPLFLVVSFGIVGNYGDSEASGSVDGVRGISQLPYLHCEFLTQGSPSHRSFFEEAEHGGRLVLLSESEPSFELRFRFELELENELDPGLDVAP